jgi:hypothetical protein
VFSKVPGVHLSHQDVFVIITVIVDVIPQTLPIALGPKDFLI